MTMIARAFRNPSRRFRIEFFLRQTIQGRDRFAKPIIEPLDALDDHPEARVHDHVDPTFSIDEESGQSLLDDLYQIGFRPSPHIMRGGEAEAPALKAHLADMRALAFAKLNVEPPK